MNRKIFLHGGVTNLGATPQQEFNNNVVDSIDESEIRVLFVYFARQEFLWEESYELDTNAFHRIDTSKKISTVMASPETDMFKEQIDSSNLIYINGGRKGCLKEKLLGVEDLSERLNEKVLVGISAGANILSKYYYSTVANQVREGIGLINVKLFCHYSKDQEENLKKLQKIEENIPILKLAENEYKVLQL